MQVTDELSSTVGFCLDETESVCSDDIVIHLQDIFNCLLILEMNLVGVIVMMIQSSLPTCNRMMILIIQNETILSRSVLQKHQHLMSHHICNNHVMLLVMQSLDTIQIRMYGHHTSNNIICNHYTISILIPYRIALILLRCQTDIQALLMFHQQIFFLVSQTSK